MAWLASNRMMVISDYHRAFQAAFDRPDVSAANLHALRKRNGWKVGRAPGRFTGRSWKFSAKEISWLRENCTLPIQEYHAAFIAAFRRSDVSADNLHSYRKRRALKTGRTGQFEKGAEPANKGKVCPPGVGGRHPNAQRTQFKKGQAPHNTKWLGHERMHENGYVYISVAETNPHTGYERRYVLKHVRLWEAANGPLPEGHCLKCMDGDRANTDPSNWTLIPRGVLPRINGGHATTGLAFDDAEPELRLLVLRVAELDGLARRRRRKNSSAAGKTAA